jgi:hypothetical protein
LGRKLGRGHRFPHRALNSEADDGVKMGGLASGFPFFIGCADLLRLVRHPATAQPSLPQTKK